MLHEHQTINAAAYRKGIDVVGFVSIAVKQMRWTNRYLITWRSMNPNVAVMCLNNENKENGVGA